MDTRIYAITHKKFDLPEESGYYPLHVGRVLSEDLGYPGDDTGESISEKNKSFCELTGLYWIWKNVSCDIVGICHYRRYFAKDGAILSQEYIETSLARYDAILPCCGTFENDTLFTQFGLRHHIRDLLTVRDIIAERHPDYLDAFDFCMNCNLFSVGNMIITKKEIFDSYCEWLFDILLEAERRIDTSSYDNYQKRVFGFLSERLLRVWFLKQNLKIHEEDYMNIDHDPNKKVFLILAPAGRESGGPEALHQLCNAIDRLGANAYMYYIDGKQAQWCDVPAPARYEKYHTRHISNSLPGSPDNIVFVFNEDLTPYIPTVTCRPKVLWWLSVDNYTNNSGSPMPLSYLRTEIDLHLVQSEYARDYLLHTVGIPEDKILKVSDYIGEAYGQFILPSAYRKNTALYNPYKGLAELKPLMEKASWLTWIPLTGLTEEQVVVLMQSSKLYVDFGGFPGKDRIPREAASCGCCVITGKKGAAAFEQDVPIPEKYKFDDIPNQYDQIERLMHEICEDFDAHSRDFDAYRAGIRGEKECFDREVGELIKYIGAMKKC